MPAVLGTLRISSGTNFGAGDNIEDSQIVYPKTKVSQIVDLLDSGGKILLKHFPGFIFGGQTFFDSLSYATSFVDLLTRLGEGAAGVNTTVENINMFAGRYFQATTTITITNTSKAVTVDDTILYQMIGNQPGTIHFFCDNETEENVTVEANDYIVFTGLSYQFEEYAANFSIINNTYGDAGTSEKGVVKLATIADITDGNDSTKAVTPKGVRLAVETFAPKHPTIGTTKGDFGIDIQQNTPRIITSINLSTDGNHIKSIGTGALPKANFDQYGLVKNASVDDITKADDILLFNEGWAVSAPIVKQLIDYWGGISVFDTLSKANTDPVRSVKDKLILVKE